MLPEYLESKLPEYTHTMYLEGYTPEEIMIAHRKKMREMIADNESVDSINIKSSIEVKDE